MDAAPAAAPAAPTGGAAADAPAGAKAPPVDAKVVPKQAVPPTKVPPKPGPAGKPDVPVKYKIPMKVDGVETVEEYDIQTLATEIQKSRGAEKRMAEAKADKARVAKAVEMFKTDPHGAAKLISGLDDAALEAAYEKRLTEKYGREFDLETGKPLPEEVKKARQMETELETFRREAAERKQAEENTKREAEVARHRQELGRRVGEVMDDIGIEDGNFRKTTVLNMIADVLEAEAEFPDLKLTKEQIAREVKSKMTTIAKHYIGTQRGPALLSALKDAGVSAIDLRDALLESVKRAPIPTTHAEPPKPPAPKATKPDTNADRLAEERRLMSRVSPLYGAVRR